MSGLLDLFQSRSTSWNIIERLIFPAPQSTYSLSSFPKQLILIPGGSGQRVPCIFLPFRHARFLIIYFHANAEDLGLCYNFCSALHSLFQVHVLAVEYPGYGICGGSTDEAGIRANAFAAMRFVTDTLCWPLDGIKICGRSLGTGPALALAAEYSVAGVILVCPYASIKALFRSQVGKLADLVDERFENEKLASQVTSPTLIIHGMQDTLIPPEHGRRIYNALLSKKMLVSPAGMGHNTSLLSDVSAFVFPMTQFFSLPDYIFEDIEVPDWVFPEEGKVSDESPCASSAALPPQSVPRPRCDPKAQAIDNQRAPAKFRLPFVGGVDLRAVGAGEAEVAAEVVAPMPPAIPTALSKVLEAPSERVVCLV